MARCGFAMDSCRSMPVFPLESRFAIIADLFLILIHVIPVSFVVLFVCSPSVSDMSKLFSLLLVVSALLPLVLAQGGSPTYDGTSHFFFVSSLYRILSSMHSRCLLGWYGRGGADVQILICRAPILMPRACDQSDAPAFRVTTALSSLNITSCKLGATASVIGLNAVLYSYNSVTKVSTQIATIATSTRAAPCWTYKYPAGVVPVGWYYVLIGPGEAGQYGTYSLSLVCPTGESTSVCSIGNYNFSTITAFSPLFYCLNVLCIFVIRN